MEHLIILCICSGLVIGIFIGMGISYHFTEKDIKKLEVKIQKQKKEMQDKDYQLQKLYNQLHKLQQNASTESIGT